MYFIAVADILNVILPVGKSQYPSNALSVAIQLCMSQVARNSHADAAEKSVIINQKRFKDEIFVMQLRGVDF